MRRPENAWPDGKDIDSGSGSRLLGDFDADFSMAGQWNFVVTFDPAGRVQFNLNARD
jgi:hypothetical protein